MGTQLSPKKKGQSSSHFWAHVYCGQTVAHLTNCRALVNGGRNGIPCCRRAVAEGKAHRPKSVDMVHGEVVGFKDGELVMDGILERYCKDRMADRLLRSYR